MPQQTPPPTDQSGASAPMGPDDTTSSGSSSGSEHTPPPVAGNRFFAWMRGLGLTRQPGWVGGVSSGIAARLGIDPLIVRGIFVVVAVLGGPALLLYAAAWLLLPDADDRIHLEEVFRGRVDSPIVGIGVIVLLSMLPITQGFWIAGAEYWGEASWGEAFGRATWTIIVLAAIVALIVWVSRRSNASSPSSSSAAPDATTPRAEPRFGDETRDAPLLTLPALTAPSSFDNDGAPVPPPAPAPNAPPEEIAAWRERQDLWKKQHNEFRQQRAGERQAASRAAQEKARIERNARYAADRAARARTRSHPLYSFIVIGLALIVGGVTTLLTGGAEIDSAAIVLGLAVALGVLALGIIVNGIRGKRSGGASGFAIVVIVALALTSSFPQGRFFAIGSEVVFTAVDRQGNAPQNFAAGFGDVTLELADFYSDTPTASRSEPVDTVNLVVGAGDVTVVIPEGEYVRLTSSVGAGEIRAENDSGLQRAVTSDTVSYDYEPRGRGAWDGNERLIAINVELGAGSITIIENAEGATNE